MRPIRECLPLVLSVILGSAIVAAQQTQPATPQKPAPPGSTKTSTPHAATPATHHAAHKRHLKAARRRGKKRPEYRPEYSENSVEVINGDATKKVVFHDEQATATPGKKVPAGMKNVPAPMKVEVVNGGATDTQYFYDNGQDNETARNRPVVIGIQSSDTRVVGGNKHPVVTGVTSSGTGDAKSASDGGQPVTKQVTPRPKRPDYQPDAH